VTLKEAEDQRIPRVRRPEWVRGAYIRLPLLAAGVGPWAELYDPTTEDVAKAITQSFEGEGFELYEGAPSPLEKENYAKHYAES